MRVGEIIFASVELPLIILKKNADETEIYKIK